MLKDQLFKPSRFRFDNWLFGPEKFSGLSRNRPLAPVVQRADNFIHWIAIYPLDKSYPLFEQPGPD